MTHDYLWDRSGEVDPEIAALERKLARYRHRGRRRLPGHVVMVAAVLALAIGVAFWLGRDDAPEGGWATTWLQGCGPGELHPGEWLRTGNEGRARLCVADVGQVDVEPRSEVRLVRTSAREHRIELAKGTIDARIFAPPRLFIVDTAGGSAIDLGCEYTLHVDETGAGLLQVRSGYVELAGHRNAFVPAGAECRLTPQGPGVPYYNDAEPSLRNVDPNKGADIVRTCGTLRAKDTLTLWHLLSRVAVDERKEIYDQIARLVPPPVDHESRILELDPRALGAWREKLERSWR